MRMDVIQYGCDLTGIDAEYGNDYGILYVTGFKYNVEQIYLKFRRCSC